LPKEGERVRVRVGVKGMAAMLPRRKRRPPAGGGGNFLLDALTLPVLGAPRLVVWIAKMTMEAAQREMFDEAAVQGALLDLQMRYDLGEMGEEEYLQQEAALLERLKLIREAKAELMREGGEPT
jgi:hypothetical protein